eukprot:SAG31_NODE_159_length_21911_cov_12.220750_1_plen_217_part_00
MSESISLVTHACIGRFYTTKRGGHSDSDSSDAERQSSSEGEHIQRQDSSDSEDDALLASADEDHRHFLARTREHVGRATASDGNDDSDISTDSEADIAQTDFRPSKAARSRARAASAGRRRPERQPVDRRAAPPSMPLDTGRPDLANEPRSAQDHSARLSFRPQSAGTDASEPESEGLASGAGNEAGNSGAAAPGEPDAEQPLAAVTGIPLRAAYC